MLTRFGETGHLTMRTRSRIGLALTTPAHEAPGRGRWVRKTAIGLTDPPALHCAAPAARATATSTESLHGAANRR